MPQRKNAVKELKKSHARRLHNLDIKTDLKKTVKAFTAALAKDSTQAAEALKLVYKKFDKAVKRNIISKNTASRRKATFTKLLLAKKA
ncbi:MAG: 30S ribosomal protein S20 [Elusimicrobia bacterium]|nr:30S ribosomal protein S20 [Elusimicrobiota bacterium]